MTASEKLEMIERGAAAGRTVYVVTATRATKCTPKTIAAWAKAGRPLFKISADGKSLMMAAGKAYVCADYCTIQV